MFKTTEMEILLVNGEVLKFNSIVTETITKKEGFLRFETNNGEKHERNYINTNYIMYSSES